MMTWNAILTSKSIHSSFNVSGIPFLQFLYQTPTILRSWRREASSVPSEAQNPPRVGAKQQRLTALKARRIPNNLPQRMPILSNPFEPSLQRVREPQAADDDAEGGPYLAASGPDTNLNVFKSILEDSSKRFTDHSTITRHRAITMTQVEHEIFERLQALSGKTKRSLLADAEGADEFDDPESGTDTLEDLFNKIARRFEKEEFRVEQEPQRSLEIYVAKQKQQQETREQAHRTLLKSVAWPQLELSEPVQPRLSSPDNSIQDIQALQSNSDKHTKKLQDLFSTAETDGDLWHVLDQHVFKMMRELHDLSKKQQIELEKRTHPKPNGKYKQKRKSEVAKASCQSKTQSDSEKALMQKMMNTYGPAVLYATRLFRTGFSSSPYASLILPTIKNLGPISYVLAASTSLYNELLYIRWETYRDLNGCADLIDEMISQNILADRHTALVYKAAKETRDHELGIIKKKRSPLISNKQDEFDAVGTEITSAPELDWSLMSTKYIPFGTPVKSFQEGYWRLQGVEAAWLRLTTSYSRLVTISRQEIKRKKDELILAKKGISAVPSATEDQASPSKTSEIGIHLEEDTDVEPEIEMLLDGDSNGPKMTESSL